MARKSNAEITSKRAASAASKILQNPGSSNTAKPVAASALARRSNRRKWWTFVPATAVHVGSGEWFGSRVSNPQVWATPRARPLSPAQDSPSTMR